MYVRREHSCHAPLPFPLLDSTSSFAPVSPCEHNVLTHAGNVLRGQVRLARLLALAPNIDAPHDSFSLLFGARLLHRGTEWRVYVPRRGTDANSLRKTSDRWLHMEEDLVRIRTDPAC